MSTKEQIAALLENSGTEFISGSDIAQKLDITRAAVWKCIKQLEEKGYEIESAKRGYRLGEKSDALSKNAIYKYLEEASQRKREVVGHTEEGMGCKGETIGQDGKETGSKEDVTDRFNIEVFDFIDSTNTYLKERAQKYLNEAKDNGKSPWYVVVSDSQSGGRGRMGRSFVSPSKSGIYLSVLFKPQLSAQQAVRMTTAAAVAACFAIEENTDKKPGIKWVNDIYIDGKKTCGILTEASIDIEGGGLDWVVIGIGFNVYEPLGGFPEELKDIAGAITGERERDLRSRITASFLSRLYDICSDLKSSDFTEEYKRRCFLIGKQVNVLRDDKQIPALVTGLDDELHLLVRYEDGSSEALNSGEVSIRGWRNGN
ncbi:MAG: biotin--[Lachnospiraceae bacterium]|nr:biotin--[acetyl-CoA-carboxylase] ligase [Lachnospiraceae bacterium]